MTAIPISVLTGIVFLVKHLSRSFWMRSSRHTLIKIIPCTAVRLLHLRGICRAIVAVFQEIRGHGMAKGMANRILSETGLIDAESVRQHVGRAGCEQGRIPLAKGRIAESIAGGEEPGVATPLVGGMSRRPNFG